MTYFDTIFSPLAGYHPSFVLLTSYTCEPGMVAELILRLALYGRECSGISQLQGRMILKNWFEKERPLPVAVLTNRFSGNSKEPGFASNRNSSGLIRFLHKHLARVVYPVPVQGGIFHPKIVLVEFEPDDRTGKTEKQYRLLLSSKNLVPDNYHQFGLVLRGVPGQKNHDLAGLGRLEIPDWVREKLAALENCCFVPEETPEGVAWDRCEVLLGGLDQPGKSALRDRFRQDVTSSDDLRIYTDSLSDEFLRSLPRTPDLVVSNAVRWRQFLSPGSIPSYAHIPKTEYLHGKLFAIRKKDRYIVWVGSANATPQGFSSNVEGVVRLEWHGQGELSQQLEKLVELPEIKALSRDQMNENVQDRVQQWSKEMKVRVSDLRDNRLTLTVSRTACDPARIRAQLPGQCRTYAALPAGTGDYEVTLPMTPGCLSERPAVLICGYMEGSWYEVTCHLELGQADWRAAWQAAFEKQGERISDNILLSNLLPALRDAIPPQRAGQPRYSREDTAQQRLAKYLDGALPLREQYQQVADNLRKLNDAILRWEDVRDEAEEEEETGLQLAREEMLEQWEKQCRQALEFLEGVCKEL